jgi:hypothetical protein
VVDDTVPVTGPPLPPGRWLRALGTALAAATAVGIVAVTAWPQVNSPLSDTSFGHWCLICGRIGTADVVQNVLLFLPFGAGLALAGRSPRTAALAALALSGAVELVQLAGVTGRFATISDVVTNTTGGWLGAVAAAGWPTWLTPSRAVARGLAAATAAGWLAVLWMTAWALDREPAPGPWPPVESHHATPPDMGWFAGPVSEARVGPLRLTHRGSGAIIVGAATGRDVRGEVIGSGSDARPFPVPMLFVHGAAAERAELVIGQVGRAAVVAVNLRAARLRLRQPWLRIPETFLPDEPATSGIERRIAGGFTDRALHISVDSRDGRRIRTLPLTAVTGWSLFLPFVHSDGPEAPLMTALWVAVFLFPFGYWVGWAVGEGGAGRLRGAAAATLALVAGLGALPALTGAPPTPAWVWIVAAAAAAVGLAAAEVRTRIPFHHPRRDASLSP